MNFFYYFNSQHRYLFINIIVSLRKAFNETILTYCFRNKKGKAKFLKSLYLFKFLIIIYTPNEKCTSAFRFLY